MTRSRCPRDEDRREFRNRHSALKSPLVVEDYEHLDDLHELIDAIPTVRETDREIPYLVEAP